jgi:hypothetical protein
MTFHATVIRYVVQALSEPHKIHPKIRETYTMTECRSRLYRGVGSPLTLRPSKTERNWEYSL